MKREAKREAKRKSKGQSKSKKRKLETNAVDNLLMGRMAHMGPTISYEDVIANFNAQVAQVNKEIQAEQR